MAAADRIPGQRAYGGVLIVQVRIGDRRARLLVDTGCAITTITPEAADHLGLARSSFTGRREIFTAAGSSLTVPIGQIPTLRVGTATLHDVAVALMSLPPTVQLDGLLGVNVLDRFRVTFDFRHAMLVLRAEPLR